MLNLAAYALTFLGGGSLIAQLWAANPTLTSGKTELSLVVTGLGLVAAAVDRWTKIKAKQAGLDADKLDD